MTPWSTPAEPHSSRPTRLRPKFFELDIAHALGVPVLLMTQSLGPFRRRSSIRRMRRLASYAQLILLRDERSLQHLVEIGADTSRVTLTARHRVQHGGRACDRPDRHGPDPP